MTNKQIFKKAILEAEKGGFNIVQYLPAFPSKGFIREEKSFILLYAIKEKILFSHDFAKTFWEKGMVYQCIDCGKIYRRKELRKDTGSPCHDVPVDTLIRWQYHLQKMILLPDNKRLKYIEKFLKVEK